MFLNFSFKKISTILVLISATLNLKSNPALTHRYLGPPNIPQLSLQDNNLKNASQIMHELFSYCEQYALGHPLSEEDLQKIDNLKKQLKELTQHDPPKPFTGPESIIAQQQALIDGTNSLNFPRHMLLQAFPHARTSSTSTYNPMINPTQLGTVAKEQNKNIDEKLLQKKMVGHVKTCNSAEQLSCIPASCNTSDDVQNCIIQCEQDVLQTVGACCADVAAKLECEPIIEITQNDIPLLITQPGHYCLVEDIKSSDFIIITINSFAVILDLNGHTIDGQNVSTIGIASVFFGGALVRNGTIKNCLAGAVTQLFGGIIFSNLTINDGEVGILIRESRDVAIDSCIINNMNSSGILAEGSFGNIEVRGLTITNCKINGAGFEGILMLPPVRACVIKNCVIENFVRGISFNNFQMLGVGEQQRIGPKSFNLKIEDCCIRDIEEVGIDLITEIENIEINRCKINNALSGIRIDTTNGALIANCQIDNVASGIQAEVLRNVYIKNLKVTNSIGFPAEVINASENITFEDCLFSGSNTVPIVRTTHFAVTASRKFTMKNCSINYTAGIPLENSNALTIITTSGVEIENCTIRTNAKASNNLDGNGILINGAVDNCRISNCTVISDPADPAQSGIAIIPLDNTSKSSGITIKNCHVEQVNGRGIVVDSAVNCEISKCTVVGSIVGNGIEINNSRGIVLLDNITTENAKDGIRFNALSRGCVARNNTSYKNDGFGLNNLGGANQIFSNFAHTNLAGNFNGVALVSAPTPGIDQVTNISG